MYYCGDFRVQHRSENNRESNLKRLCVIFSSILQSTHGAHIYLVIEKITSAAYFHTEILNISSLNIQILLCEMRNWILFLF